MDAILGRFTTPDPLAEKFPNFSPYAHCTNNPMGLIDFNGMYFDEVNEKSAKSIEEKIDKRISTLIKQVDKLEKQRKNFNDLNTRIAELNKSKTDISDMRTNSTIEFRYAKSSSTNLPSTIPNGINDKGHDVITMYTESNAGSKIHESAHGGQIARGDYGFDSSNNPTDGYGLNSEVSAYRQQFSYDGNLSYIDATNTLNQQLGNVGIIGPISKVTNIMTITPDFIKANIGEVRSTSNQGKEFFSLIPIYGGLR